MITTLGLVKVRLHSELLVRDLWLSNSDGPHWSTAPLLGNPDGHSHESRAKKSQRERTLKHKEIARSFSVLNI